MSRRVEKLIEEEDQHILWLLHFDEALFVQAEYFLDKDGKRVYDREAMREEFEENMETLISLNEQRESSEFWERRFSEKPIAPDAPEGFKKMRWPKDFDSKH